MEKKNIDPRELTDNFFEAIGKEWMLVTAGNKEKFNMMTASWGCIGWLWNKPVAVAFIRPERFTHEFIEKEDRLTLCFLGESEEMRKAYALCGAKSGRDCDKVSETGLTPADFGGSVAFEEADLVLVCRKLYSYDLTESGFLTDDGIPAQFFASDPYHRAYISEIVGVYVKE